MYGTTDNDGKSAIFREVAYVRSPNTIGEVMVSETSPAWSAKLYMQSPERHEIGVITTKAVRKSEF
jgi:hypothetical protein